ncbi:N-acetylmuramoyl-L-alanine amidase [Paraclostridium bifermentans]|uniref:N-acetylmuramoyl-L-alanine amidase n=1 Tax=Paraclostridium bifermentans TaxID=1490 RepID=UPI00359C1061
MVKKVFLDPGHGGNDSGAVGVNNLLEKNINLSVAKKVYDILKKQNLDVRLSRSDDSTISLNSRTEAANKWGADCYISIHCNSFNTTAQGIETFSYSTKTNDLANHIHNEILDSKIYTKNRGLKTANFYVLRKSSMRSCLIELAFIDNNEDSKLLIDKQDSFALSIAIGICEYLGVKFTPTPEKPSSTPQPPVIDSNTFYRVVCGSFNNRVYAEEIIENLKANGYDAFIDIFKK